MATTKIWPIKDSLSRVVEYARNPEKTDLHTVLHYAADGIKTYAAEEHSLFVTGINCNANTAFQEMRATQERLGKTGGNVAYHAYQSFKPGEVTPELCHKLEAQLARRMWGTGYQVLVATHFNTGTYHNHLVVNSVGLWDGKKFDCSKRAYYELRRLSDELCRRLDSIDRQTRLICRERFDTTADVELYLDYIQTHLETLQAFRRMCYYRLRRCHDPMEITSIRAEWDKLTASITLCRRDIKTAQDVLGCSEKVKADLAAERTMQKERLSPQKQHTRQREEAR